MLQENGLMNAFTVDLEDWFQGLTSTNPLVDQWPTFESRVVQATQRLLALLNEQQVKATFFVLGYVADAHPDLVEMICSQGHEIGVHGYYHRFVTRLTADEFAQELDQTIEVIYRITGQSPIGHRAPYFSLNSSTPWAFDILESRGFLYDSSVFPIRNTLYGFPEAPRFPYKVGGHQIFEFPASTMSIAGIKWPIAGGFYNRAMPYAMIRHGIRQTNKQGEPAIIYVHPWELDTEQVYSQVTVRERITHYHGRRRLQKKLRQLLSEFQFGTLQELMLQMAASGEYQPDELTVIST